MTAQPELTAENTAFWTTGAEGRLSIGHCDACGRSIHPPQPACPVCLCDAVHVRAAEGTGTVVARTVNRQQWAADMVVPFALAVVELDGEDGVRLTAQVDCADPERLAIGDRVRVAFAPEGRVWRPYFSMAEAVA